MLLSLPDELITLILYNVDKIFNLSLTCKHINNLIDWTDYFERKTNKCILSVLDKSIDIRSHKYFMNIVDNEIISQIVLYYPSIKYIPKFIEKHDYFYIDTNLINHRTIRVTRQKEAVKFIYAKYESVQYFNVNLEICEYFYELMSKEKITNMKYSCSWVDKNILDITNDI
jgi:hypothetical protein